MVWITLRVPIKWRSTFHELHDNDYGLNKLLSRTFTNLFYESLWTSMAQFMDLIAPLDDFYISTLSIVEIVVSSPVVGSKFGKAMMISDCYRSQRSLWCGESRLFWLSVTTITS